MTSSLKNMNAMSLFVEDLQAAKTFYLEVFGVEVLFEDEVSVALGFENIIINLLGVQNAREIVDPGAIATRDSGSRFHLSIWVPDVDAVCLELQKRGVELLAGPRDKPWGMRTANFVDPAGHSWGDRSAGCSKAGITNRPACPGEHCPPVNPPSWRKAVDVHSRRSGAVRRRVSSAACRSS
jgi:catechol 2,3-dioxygenase-like lactoylglutathione lyase family enzyme